MTIRPLLSVLLPLVGLALWLGGSVARGAEVAQLLGDPVHDRGGQRVGTIEDLIVDVRSGRIVYVIVEAPDRFYTLPIRALDERLRLNMDLASAAARQPGEGDPKFRRAARLLEQPVDNPGEGTVGRIADIEFDPRSGEVQHVVVQTNQGARNFPPSVLAHGRFPALTRWQVENPDAGAGASGFQIKPSDERKSVHPPQ